MRPHPEQTPAALWRQELEDILTSRSFARAKRLRELLTWLVEQIVSGRQDRLNEYDAALDLRARTDHDPAVQSDVRKLLSRLRRRLAEYYSLEAAHRRHQIQLPGGFEPRLVARTRPEPPGAARSMQAPPWLVYFAGVRCSDDADPDIVQVFEAELLYRISTEGGVCTSARSGAELRALVRGRAWGKQPVDIVIQLIERTTGVLLSQTRQKVWNDPRAAARGAMKDLRLRSHLEGPHQEAGAEEKPELEKSPGLHDPE